jgi:aldehyde dehydrogenase (NAD+)
MTTPVTVSALRDDPRLLTTRSRSEQSIDSINPSTGRAIASVKLQSRAEYDSTVARCVEIQKHWRRLPAPQRGEIIRRIGNAFRTHKRDLGELISLEVGKTRAEGEGEVQEAIDIADFAVGLSRQLYGLTIHSERPNHRMYEQWHPLGTIGIITAFNFPIAVWAWNAMLAAVCGDAMIWKPSLHAPLCAIAVTKIVHEVMRAQDVFQPERLDPADLFALIVGRDEEIGEAMLDDRRLPLISATGSCRMGSHVGAKVAMRLGRALLELGGNNGIIIMPDADLELVIRGVVFGAVGTAGQRCTSTRRLFVHTKIVHEVTNRLVSAYESISIGDPLDPKTLMGPLINRQAVDAMHAALEQARAEGCQVVCGGNSPSLSGTRRGSGSNEQRSMSNDLPSGFFVSPSIVRIARGGRPKIAEEETFAPILYIYEVADLEEAIDLNNSVSQGLSSAIFTDSVRSAERFLSVDGSDCGIANVNIGTSGAEIGGAFGGEKDTGGGRESGSDAWKNYMRRQTCTINWGTDLPLSQGIQFGE